MNSGFTKLFGDLISSSIWQKPNDAKVLWITMLAMKEKDQVCRATIPFLAKTCDMTLDRCVEVLQEFESPDKYSRSKVHKGARIAAVDDGWKILNGQAYQEKLSKEDRREKNAEAAARYRGKKTGRRKERDPLGKGQSHGCLHPDHPPGQ